MDVPDMIPDQAEADVAERRLWEAERFWREEQYMLLPLPFQERILGFRERKADFWKVERTEFRCCDEAMKIVARLTTSAEVEVYVRSSPEEQRHLVPELEPLKKVPAIVGSELAVEQVILGAIRASAMALALAYRKDPSSVVKAHGALCLLFGCEECGCWALIAESN